MKTIELTEEDKDYLIFLLDEDIKEVEKMGQKAPIHLKESYFKERDLRLEYIQSIRRKLEAG